MDISVTILGLVCCILCTFIGFLLGALLIFLPGCRRPNGQKHFPADNTAGDADLRGIHPASQSADNGPDPQDIAFTDGIPAQFMEAYFKLQHGVLSEQDALEQSGLTPEEFQSYKDRMQCVSAGQN